MIPSAFFGLNRPIGIEDTTVRRWGNRPGQCEAWQFGLIEIRVAELAMICRLLPESSGFVAARSLCRTSPNCFT